MGGSAEICQAKPDYPHIWWPLRAWMTGHLTKAVLSNIRLLHVYVPKFLL